ncbi:MAG: hypothetical protein K9N62_18325, partial [Verrucomicrobia bacterium]|nr:hypothetical protein [Verrucomicrobiota bacterium]
MTAVAMLSIAHDADGRFWIGTQDFGVLCFDGQTWSRITTRDGQLSDDVWAICQDTSGDYWFGGSKGLTRYHPGRTPPSAPRLTVLAKERYRDLSQIPEVTQGDLVSFQFEANDLKTRSDAVRYRHRIVSGPRDKVTTDGEWSKPADAGRFEWNPPRAGEWTFAVQSIDRDRNVSAPAMVTIRALPLWYLNARIMAPGGIGVSGLALVAVVATWRARHRKLEAERLREQMLRVEHEAREAAEHAAETLAVKNTQLEEARIPAESANQPKSRLVASMSHELRTPLTAIIGFSELLLSEAQADGKVEQSEDLARIHGSATHLLGLINDILDLSKIEAR